MKKYLSKIDGKLRSYVRHNPREAFTLFYAYNIGLIWIISYTSKLKVVYQGYLVPVWLYGAIIATIIAILLWAYRIRNLDKPEEVKN